MNKALRIVKNGGIDALSKRAAAYVYRKTIRRMLPTIACVRYSGVPISREKKFGDKLLPDFLIPHLLEDIVDYEQTLISALQSQVHPGDKVTIVGGGEGVTAVVAAKTVGETGSVICFEGNNWMARQVRATGARNGMSRRLTVKCAVVGVAIEVYGGEDDHSSLVVRAEELPECDVLELDCEGSEIGILSNMTSRPRTIIVETHGANGSPTSKVKNLLEDLNYRVGDWGVAEPRCLELCESNDIRVLVAERDSVG